MPPQYLKIAWPALSGAAGFFALLTSYNIAFDQTHPDTASFVPGSRVNSRGYKSTKVKPRLAIAWASISIGCPPSLVAKDGRELYAESSEVDWSKASPWTLKNVRPQLEGKGVSLKEIGYALRIFTDHDEEPVFWGYFPAYDWVAFVGLFGGLEELPFHYPQLCLDKQWAIELGDPELKNDSRGTARQRILDLEVVILLYSYNPVQSCGTEPAQRAC